MNDRWRDVFPEEAARKVLAYILVTWQSLTSRPNPHLNWTFKEPDITKRFKQHLENNAEAAGLTGAWGAESVSLALDPITGEPLREWRTDIVYHSDRDPNRILRLTLEFKKLKNTSGSRKAYYGQKGMDRFLRGDYARRSPLGIMVGLIESHAHRDHIRLLKTDLVQEPVALALRYVPDPKSQACLRDPSVIFPGIAEFDSQHHRLTEDFDSFTFSHVFLVF